ncbi:MAG: LysM peptidoglycan-binding domain-containing protein [Caldilineaceae bacterium]|nr:LysM peptidoglycan-binding domain-containing protein [Caldilineaceae bacterium]
MSLVRNVLANGQLFRSRGIWTRLTLALIVASLVTVGFVTTPAAAAPKDVDVEAPSYSVYYIVQPGDTLSAIARRYGTTVTAIANANGISNPSKIYVGQRLYIPSGSVGSPSTPWPVDSIYYIVKPGDTLSGLARRYNTTVQAIARANGISNTSYIWVGQRLIMPTGYAYPPSVYGFYYTVKPGDTLSSIAKWYGINMYSLAAVNGISNISYIYVGQRLYIP